ncbi:MerR family transcriptional regulator [Rufibacter latericius]|uniref:MerR family transcriptional regulator n=1 Tax=Rufibacter latericius TaxID=2487040 RepID=A0A3M9MUU6_9BACT|nr:MerR family transcriptional regulator [Rufibacter latericius]RNI29291.1 MerR family transcriptional regulator [Rufibacter latericius]
MAHYSIKELEHLSGIKAHTLRIWEQRYQLLAPKRTSTNIRYYDDADLKNLLNVAVLYQEGYKISKIAKLLPDQVAREVLKVTESDLDQDQFMSQLIIAMVELDESLFERVLSRAVLQLGFPASVKQIIYPFLTKIGLLWQTGNITPAHEHFISQLIRQKMLVAIDGQRLSRRADTPKVLLYLPEGELHELSLLYSHFQFRAWGFRTLYLGQHLPFEDLVKAAQQYQPHYICSAYTTSPPREEVEEYLAQLRKQVPDAQLLLSGYILQPLKQNLPEQVHYFETLDAFEQWLSQFRMVPA